MASGVFIIREDGQLIEMQELPYDFEADLQKYLADYPSLLSGDQIDSISPRRWLLISREAALPSEEEGIDRWSVDHLFLDQDAIPTLVEVKRGSNTQIRRKVVGQMLDYAANAVVFWPVEEIKAKFEATCNALGRDSDEVLQNFLGDSADQDSFWLDVKTNLQAGRIRMLFVADEIPQELRRIVEFLNAQMDPAEVLAIEIKQYLGGGLKSIIPKVYGQTEAARAQKDISPRVQWDEESFFTQLKLRRGLEEEMVAKKILDWTKANMMETRFGKGAKTGAIYPILYKNGEAYSFICLYTYGRVEIRFGKMRERPPFSELYKRKELQKQLNNIQGVSIPDDALDKYPAIPLSALRQGTNLSQFLQALDWIIQEIRAS